MKKNFVGVLSVVLSLLLLSGCGIFPTTDKGAEEKYLLIGEVEKYEVADEATIIDYEYTFDAENRITKREAYSNGEIIAVNYYDENENIVEEYTYASLRCKHEYENGKKVKTYHYNNGSLTGFSIYADVAPSIVDEIRYDVNPDNPNGIRNDYWYRYEYNAYGDIERESWYMGSMCGRGNYYNYEHDENGNTISKSMMSVGDDGFYTTYTYMTLEEYLNK